MKNGGFIPGTNQYVSSFQMQSLVKNGGLMPGTNQYVGSF